MSGTDVQTYRQAGGRMDRHPNKVMPPATAIFSTETAVRIEINACQSVCNELLHVNKDRVNFCIQVRASK